MIQENVFSCFLQNNSSKATQDLFGEKTQVAQQSQNLILFLTHETEENESYTMEKLFLLGLCNFTKKYVTIGWQL